jgi:hypothetical protein
MPFPVQLLRTRAECDQALESLNAELRVFTVNDQVLDLRADQAGDRAADRAQEITATTATVARLTPLVAGLTAGTDEHALTSRLLTRATRRLEDLTSATPVTASGPLAFLKAVDVRQVQVQVPELQAAIAEVTAHRPTLTA